jgi:predicted HicB family RNase H-like nuclease
MDTVTQTEKQTEKEPPVIRVRVTDELNERVRIEAIKRRMSLQQLCTEALTEYLDRH